MSLIAAIEEVCQCFTKPPSNEKNTELRVVYPLLLAMGYTPHDIDGGNRDVAGYFPDYTLLPEQPEFTWYIEVKAWFEALDDKGKHQAIDYANRNGKRWVVLTNGRQWRLYDNYIRGVADDKLVMEVALNNAKAIQSLLSALSKDSICTNGLERFGLKARLSNILHREVANAHSRLVNAIVECLKSDYSLEHVQNTNVAEFFREALVTSVPSPLPKQTIQQQGLPVPSVVRKSTETRGEQMPNRLEFTLGSLASVKDSKTGKDVVTFREPHQVKMPDDSGWRECGTWADLDEMFVRWLHEQGKMPPLPYQITKSKYYINWTCYHALSHDKMKDYREINTGVSSIYVFTHGSAIDHVRRLNHLCHQVRVPADKVIVRLQGK